MIKINQKSEAERIFADVEYVLAHAIKAPGQVWVWGNEVDDGCADITYEIPKTAARFEREHDAPILVEIFDHWLEVSISTSETTLTRTIKVPGILEDYLQTIPQPAAATYYETTEKREGGAWVEYGPTTETTRGELVNVLAPVPGMVDQGMGEYRVLINDAETGALVDEVFYILKASVVLIYRYSDMHPRRFFLKGIEGVA